MQTFLPFPDFDASARVLDSMRLGKQRLESLQALRALVLPVYGWSTHPVARMWRGYVPALTLYTLAIIDEWTARGNRDTIRQLVLEFAPEAEGAGQEALSMPRWLGTAQFQDSHRSNLVRKLPEHYRPFFPDVPDDLPYYWPEPEAPEGADVISPEASDGWIVRARTVNELREWSATGIVTFPDAAPSTGRRTKAWTVQEADFRALRPGDPIAVVHADADTLPSAKVVGEVTPYRTEHESGLRIAVEFDRDVPRSAFPHPALLQDPRTLFRAAIP